MSDSFTETSVISWGSRLKDSIKSVLVGFLLFVISFPLLFWNEGRAVKRAKTLETGAAAVVSVSSDKVDPANEGKLVHMTGEATTSDVLQDPIFGVSQTAIRLERVVEMYQWDEDQSTKTVNKTGGKQVKETTYSYKTVWSESLIDSSSFHVQEARSSKRNPGSMPYQSSEWEARNATIGAFRLTPGQISGIGNSSQLRMDETSLAALSPEVKGKVGISDGMLYMPVGVAAGGTAGTVSVPASPSVGDVRVTFNVVLPATISIVYRQIGDTFEPFKTETGDLALLKMGTMSADSMFQAAQQENAILTWILRVVGFVFMAAGIGMFFKPLVTVADVLPILGDLLGAGVFIFAAVLAFGLSVITIAIAWLFYRPILGVILIVVAVGAVVGMKFALGKKKTEPAV